MTSGIAIFREDDEAAAHGYLVHVFVDRGTRSAVAIPSAIRAALERMTTIER